jgi:hypothetical protein
MSNTARNDRSVFVWALFSLLAASFACVIAWGDHARRHRDSAEGECNRDCEVTGYGRAMLHRDACFCADESTTTLGAAGVVGFSVQASSWQRLDRAKLEKVLGRKVGPEPRRACSSKAQGEAPEAAPAVYRRGVG